MSTTLPKLEPSASMAASGINSQVLSSLVSGNLFNPLLPLLGNPEVVKGMYQQTLKSSPGTENLFYLTTNSFTIYISEISPTLSGYDCIVDSPSAASTSSLPLPSMNSQSPNGGKANKVDSPLNLSKIMAIQKSLSDSQNNGSSSAAVAAAVACSDDHVSAGESDNDDESSAHGGPRSTGGSSTKSSQNKRYRTNLTNLQIHTMKRIFNDYKTPTMAECELLGNAIGLQKRVVQVWFQNARAKEKKGRQSGSCGSNTSEPADTVATHCSMCDVTYSHLSTLQDHIFSGKHINEIRRTFTGKLTDTDRLALLKQQEEVSTLANSLKYS